MIPPAPPAYSIRRPGILVEQSEVGLTHVNLHTAHKEPQLPFGGVKRSGCGLPEAGRSGIEFFTWHQVAYVRYRSDGGSPG